MSHEQLRERVDIVKDLLRPDAIRAHRVAEGLQLDGAQLDDLNQAAHLVSAFANGMDALGREAIEAPGRDRLMRTVRSLLGTEPLHQARLRGDKHIAPLPPQLAKADLIITTQGLKIVEVEPGKIRGLGYARMVRAQANRPVGISAETALTDITGGRTTGVVLSETDRFHEPELGVLGRFVTGLVVAPQRALSHHPDGGIAVRGDGPRLEQSIMMSPFHNGRGIITEKEVRQATAVVSDNRPDLESKGAMALVHNAGGNEEVEQLLLRHFEPGTLQRLREAIPLTVHVSLLTEEQVAGLREDVTSSRMPVFLKPLATSGTRGIVTPDQHEEIVATLAKHKSARSVVVQLAHEVVSQHMQGMDVLDRTVHDDLMNIRLTIHTDRAGHIIEASVVGSPHKHLAHGGKTSVITNIEAPKR